MMNKIYKFVVINKNNMTDFRHYAMAEDVGAYLLGRKLDNILVIVNERQVVPVSALGTNDIRQIERILDEMVKA